MFRTKRLHLITAAALSMFLSGCGSGNNSVSVLSKSASAAGVLATLSENAQTIPLTGSVTYTMMVTNNNSSAITFERFTGSPFGSNFGFDDVFSVKNANEVSVYSASSTPVLPTDPIPTFIVQPGQSVTGTFTFSPQSVQAATGEYFANVELSFSYSAPVTGTGTTSSHVTEEEIYVPPLQLNVR